MVKYNSVSPLSGDPASTPTSSTADVERCENVSLLAPDIHVDSPHYEEGVAAILLTVEGTGSNGEYDPCSSSADFAEK